MNKLKDSDKEKVVAFFEHLPQWEFQRMRYISSVTIRSPQGNALIIMRAVSAEGPRVCFVGGEDATAAMVKAVNLAKQDGLKWKVDEFAMREGDETE